MLRKNEISAKYKQTVFILTKSTVMYHLYQRLWNRAERLKHVLQPTLSIIQSIINSPWEVN